MATDSDSSKPASEAQAAAPELRLLDRRAFVGFPPLELAPGLSIADFALQIPDVTFPFNVSAGASRYQRKKLLFGFLELHVDADLVVRKVAELAGRVVELEALVAQAFPATGVAGAPVGLALLFKDRARADALLRPWLG